MRESFPPPARGHGHGDGREPAAAELLRPPDPRPCWPRPPTACPSPTGGVRRRVTRPRAPLPLGLLIPGVILARGSPQPRLTITHGCLARGSRSSASPCARGTPCLWLTAHPHLLVCGTPCPWAALNHRSPHLKGNILPWVLSSLAHSRPRISLPPSHLCLQISLSQGHTSPASPLAPGACLPISPLARRTPS